MGQRETPQDSAPRQLGYVALLALAAALVMIAGLSGLDILVDALQR